MLGAGVVFGGHANTWQVDQNGGMVGPSHGWHNFDRQMDYIRRMGAEAGCLVYTGHHHYKNMTHSKGDTAHFHCNPKNCSHLSHLHECLLPVQFLSNFCRAAENNDGNVG